MSDEPRIHMSEASHLLQKLQEECNEVGQRASKINCFGLHEIQAGQPHTNQERLVQELNDLIAVISMLAGIKVLPYEWIHEGMMTDKKNKVRRYMKYSRAQGCLEPDKYAI